MNNSIYLFIFVNSHISVNLCLSNEVMNKGFEKYFEEFEIKNIVVLH